MHHQAHMISTGRERCIVSPHQQQHTLQGADSLLQFIASGASFRQWWNRHTISAYHPGPVKATRRNKTRTHSCAPAAAISMSHHVTAPAIHPRSIHGYGERALQDPPEWVLDLSTIARSDRSDRCMRACGYSLRARTATRDWHQNGGRAHTSPARGGDGMQRRQVCRCEEALSLPQSRRRKANHTLSAGRSGRGWVRMSTAGAPSSVTGSQITRVLVLPGTVGKCNFPLAGPALESVGVEGRTVSRRVKNIGRVYVARLLDEMARRAGSSADDH